MKKWSELNHTTRCAVVDVVCVALCILLLTFCSCYEAVQDGVVTTVESSIHYGYQYKVRIKKLKSPTEAYGGDSYWIWTNEVLMVGDTIHIGKVTKRRIDYER